MKLSADKAPNLLLQELRAATIAKETIKINSFFIIIDVIKFVFLLKGHANILKVGPSCRKDPRILRYFSIFMLLLKIPDVTRMMKQNLLTETTAVYMGVNFRGGNALMPQHDLNGAQVGTSF